MRTETVALHTPTVLEVLAAQLNFRCRLENSTSSTRVLSTTNQPVVESWTFDKDLYFSQEVARHTDTH